MQKRPPQSNIGVDGRLGPVADLGTRSLSRRRFLGVAIGAASGSLAALTAPALVLADSSPRVAPPEESIFSSAGEVQRTVGAAFQAGVQSGLLAPISATKRLQAQILISGPLLPIAVRLGDRASPGETFASPDGTVCLSATTAHRLLVGSCMLATELAQERVLIEGDRRVLAPFVPWLPLARDGYRQILLAEGRADLAREGAIGTEMQIGIPGAPELTPVS